MHTATNRLDVPEISAYSKQVTDDEVIVRYLVRYPGESMWQSVKLVRPARPEDRWLHIPHVVTNDERTYP